MTLDLKFLEDRARDQLTWNLQKIVGLRGKRSWQKDYLEFAEIMANNLVIVDDVHFV